MKKQIKKAAALLLTAALVVGTTACGTKGAYRDRASEVKARQLHLHKLPRPHEGARVA